jgi:hypothetical protein
MVGRPSLSVTLTVLHTRQAKMALAARANVASTRGFLGKRVSRVSNGCRVVMRQQLTV